MVPQTFIPDSDSSSSAITVELPPGVLLSQTAQASNAAYQILRRHPEVKSVVESIGEDEEGEVRSGNIYVQLVPPSQRKLTQKQFEAAVTKELRVIPDARLNFRSQADGNGRDLTLFVVGSNPDLVEHTARTAIEQMRTLKELRDPRINGDMARPELVIHPRLDLAAQLGVTVAAISDTVRVATLGEIAQNEAKFSLAGRQIPIRVSLVESARSNLATLENLPVRTASGATVPAQGRRRDRLRAGALEDPPLQPDPAPVARGRPQPYRTRSRAQEDPRRCRSSRTCPPACRSSTSARRSTWPSYSRASCWPWWPASCWCSRCWCCCSRASSSRSRSWRRCRSRWAAPWPALLVTGSPFSHGHRARHIDADGPGGQELDPAGGVRHRGNARRQGPADGAARGGPQAGAAHRHDLGGDDRRHAAAGARRRRRRRAAGPDGDRRDRRARDLDRADPGDGARRLHLDR